MNWIGFPVESTTSSKIHMGILHDFSSISLQILDSETISHIQRSYLENELQYGDHFGGPTGWTEPQLSKKSMTRVSFLDLRIKAPSTRIPESKLIGMRLLYPRTHSQSILLNLNWIRMFPYQKSTKCVQVNTSLHRMMGCGRAKKKRNRNKHKKILIESLLINNIIIVIINT